MESEFLQRLQHASLTKFFVPERDIEWSPAFTDSPPLALPESLVSLYSLPVFEQLSPERRAHLARHEVSSMFSISIRFEDLLIRNLTRMVHLSDPLDPKVPYLLHEVEEEARHNRMFVRLIREVGVGSYPLRGALGSFEYFVSNLIARSPSLFLVGVLAVEDLTDSLFASCLDSDQTHPIVRQVCRIHRIEEARHIRFAEELLRERYQRAGLFEKALVRYVGPIVITLIFDLLVRPSVYFRSGVVSSEREAWKLWLTARSCGHRRDLRRDAARSLVSLLTEIGAVDRRSRRYWIASGLLAS